MKWLNSSNDNSHSNLSNINYKINDQIIKYFISGFELPKNEWSSLNNISYISPPLIFFIVNELLLTIGTLSDSVA